MKYSEIFDEILKNHGESYMSYSLKTGHAKNHALRLFKHYNMMADTFQKCLSDFDAKIYADNGKSRVFMGGVLSEMVEVPLRSILSVLRTLGYSMIVVDGEDGSVREYVVDMGVIDETEKSGSRKKRDAEGVDADLHGEVPV